MKTIRLLLLGVAAGSCGCISINAPDTLIPTGGPFVLTGTSEVIDRNGPCLVWQGDNGITYHLFQDPMLDSGLFDQVTTPGVTSRLELSVRTDLDVACRVGPTAEVMDVLDVIP